MGVPIPPFRMVLVLVELVNVSTTWATISSLAGAVSVKDQTVPGANGPMVSVETWTTKPGPNGSPVYGVMTVIVTGQYEWLSCVDRNERAEPDHV